MSDSAASTLRRLTVQTQESVTYDPEKVQALYDVLAPDPELYGDEPAFALYLYLNGSPAQADVFTDGSDFDTWPEKDEAYDPEA